VGSAVFHAVSAQNGTPVMGCVQNTLTMAGVCTNIFDSPRQTGDSPTCELPNGEPGYEIMISRNTVMDAYTAAEFTSVEIRNYLKRIQRVYPQYVESTPKGLRLAKYVNGKVLYSIVFPTDLRWKKHTKYNRYYPTVVIHDGILTPESGPLCKGSIGATSASVIHLMWRRHPRLNEEFINRLVMISSVLNFRIGFSFSYGDCMAVDSVSKNIKVAIEEANRATKAIIEKGLDPEDEEKEINNAYNKIREIAPTITDNMVKGMHSSLVILTTFGIKGNPNNASQTAGITGQQNLSAKRIPWACTNKTRMTPHFLRNDKNPMAKGFVFHSYMDGLDYRESMAAAIAGREGVVATGTKTADSGYAQKKMSKFVGDVRAYGDGTLRNAQGRIISTIYGGDGLCPKMKIISHSPENGVISGPKVITFVKIDAKVLTLESLFERKFVDGLTKGDLPPKSLITLEQATAIVSSLECGAPGYQTAVTAQATKNLREWLIGVLTTITTYPQILPDLAEGLYDELERAKVYDGYSAGLVAVLSIGEIGTQLTLNTFHVTGIGERNASAGISRLNETLNVTAKPKAPGMIVYLRDPILDLSYERGGDEGKLMGLKRSTEIANSLKYHVVENFLSKPPVLLRTGGYDPAKESPLSFEGKYSEFQVPGWMNYLVDTGFQEMPDLEAIEWVIELNLDVQRLYEHSLTPWDVAEVLEEYHETGGTMTYRSVRCIPSPASEGKVLVFLNPDDTGNYARELVFYPDDMVLGEVLYTADNIAFFATREIAKMITGIQLGGIYGVNKAFPRLEVSRDIPQATPGARVGSATQSLPSLAPVPATPVPSLGRWVIDTAGTNLSEVLADPLVDPTRTISDHFREVESTLGIEAGRAFLESELKRVVKFDGAEVDDCHFSVIADAMSFSGVLMSVSRHGISRDVGPLSKLMFERPVTEAANSVIYGDIDRIKTIDAAVYMGQAPKLGTGTVKVISGEIARSTEGRGGANGTNGARVFGAR